MYRLHLVCERSFFVGVAGRAELGYGCNHGSRSHTVCALLSTAKGVWMLSEADAGGGWTFHEVEGQGSILTKRMYRRQLAVWQDGRLFQFQVDTDTATLKMGRRSTAAAAKLAAEKAARPAPSP